MRRCFLSAVPGTPLVLQCRQTANVFPRLGAGCFPKGDAPGALWGHAAWRQSVLERVLRAPHGEVGLWFLDFHTVPAR